MKSAIPKRRIKKALRTIYNMPDVSTIDQLDNRLREIRDVDVLRQMHIESIAQVEKESYFMEFGMGPNSAIYSALLTGMIAIMVIVPNAANKIPEILLGYAVVIIAVTFAIAWATRGNATRKTANILIRQAIERRIRDVETYRSLH